MPVCTWKMQKQWVLCSYIILQYKTCQINFTASKLSTDNYSNKHHTFKEYVNNIDFLARPGPNVPYAAQPKAYAAQPTAYAAQPKYICESLFGHSST